MMIGTMIPDHDRREADDFARRIEQEHTAHVVTSGDADWPGATIAGRRFWVISLDPTVRHGHR